MIEVKATRSFSHAPGWFVQGHKYQVDPDDPLVKGLMAGGYLVSTQEVDDDRMDSRGTGPGAGIDLDPGMAGGPQAPQGHELDGQDQAEQTAD